MKDTILSCALSLEFSAALFDLCPLVSVKGFSRFLSCQGIDRSVKDSAELEWPIASPLSAAFLTLLTGLISVRLCPDSLRPDQNVTNWHHLGSGPL